MYVLKLRKNHAIAMTVALATVAAAAVTPTAQAKREDWYGTRNAWASGECGYVEGTVDAGPGYGDRATSLSVWRVIDDRGLPIVIYSNRAAKDIPAAGSRVRISGKRDAAAGRYIMEESGIEPLVSRAASATTPAPPTLAPAPTPVRSDPMSLLPWIALGGLMIGGGLLLVPRLRDIGAGTNGGRASSAPGHSSFPGMTPDPAAGPTPPFNPGVTPQLGFESLIVHSPFVFVDEASKKYPIPAKSLVTMGRSPDCDVLVNGTGVSRAAYELVGSDQKDATGLEMRIGDTTNPVTIVRQNQTSFDTGSNTMVKLEEGDSIFFVGGPCLKLIREAN